MTRPITQIGDEVRELNDTELAQYELDLAQAIALAAAETEAATAQAAAKLSAQTKLAALGLTADEIAAL